MLRRLQADDEASDAGWACTTTSLSRSRVTSSRTPASCCSRSGATRSRRRGVASGHRKGASASSPRPTSTSSTSTSWPSTTTSRSPASSPRRCRELPIPPPVASRSTTASSSRASTGGSASRTRPRPCRSSTSWTSCLRRRGVTPGRGRAEPRSGRAMSRPCRDPHDDTDVRHVGCATSVSRIPFSTRVSTSWRP